ncbi:MAG: GHKL domain-containing protein, partial [Clostridia bacterium]|nr:GHKL domain-containing protein [Clostridia bacterium]
VSILADGKAMWRVIENIFDNLTKYARADSRVYIDLFKRQDQGVLVVKNISEEALDISPEELMQRFVRGAESRSTEGSGLGLSIAEGLIKAQKGSFNIEIDGDLFKVTIELPLKE